MRTPSMRAARLIDRLIATARATRPDDPEVAEALRARWEELPDHVRTPAQVLGRRTTGCEGTHGVFPACDFACTPCYHSADANRVRTDGAHTRREVEAQMNLLRRRHGPHQHAQLIGGEVSLLDPEDHAATLEVMHRYQRFPMSFTHGDFDEEYLRRLAVRADGTRRFDTLAFAVHIDTTMRGRRGARRPHDERQLNEHRRRFVAMCERVRRDHGVRFHLAHNMTVTPANLDQVADVVADCRDLGFRVFSFQPAAHVGNEARWRDDYRRITDDDVWAEVERGAGTRLPYRALAIGDLRCNRTTWGLWVGDRYVPLLDDRDPRDLRARDAFLAAFGPNLLFAPRPVVVARVARTLLAHRADLGTAAAWVARLVRRAGGPAALARHGAHPTTYVMHSFMDAADVAPAWAMLERGEVADDERLRATQERLQACSYTMAHPDRDALVPACVQHGVLDPGENASLVELLPRRRRQPAGAPPLPSEG